MRKMILLFTMVAGCIDAPDITTQAQAVCRDNPDTCPGGHPITIAVAKAMTNNYAATKERLAGASNPTPMSACYIEGGHAICHAGDYVSPTVYVSTQCDIALDGSSASCSSISCTEDVCHAI